MSFQIGITRYKEILREVIPLQATNEFEIWDEENDGELFTIATDIQSFATTPDGEFLPHRMVDGQLVPLDESEFLTEVEFHQAQRQHELEAIEAFSETRQPDQVRDANRGETIEPYNHEFAQESLQNLTELCNQFPDKLFVCSGGNINSDFYATRAQMEENGNWPDNLIIVAARHYSPLEGHKTPCDGADVYFNENISSSEAAARVSAIASILINREDISDITETKRRILEYSQETFTIDYQTDGEQQSREAQILNLTQVAEGLTLG